MGKDFKIGLMAGVVLGFIMLVWVATRPSQSPEARILGPSAASSQEALPLPIVPPAPPEAESDTPLPAAPQPNSPMPTDETLSETESTRDVASIFDRPLPEPVQPNEPDTARYEQAERIETTRFHIVQSGETLSGISQQYYGSASRWRSILEANRETVPDANKISPGTKLVIP